MSEPREAREPEESQEPEENPVIVFDPLNPTADENPDSIIPIPLSYHHPSFIQLSGQPIPKGFPSLSALRADRCQSRLLPSALPPLTPASDQESQAQEIACYPARTQALKKQPKAAVPNPCSSISAFGPPMQFPRKRIQRCPSASSNPDYRDLTWALGIRSSNSMFDRPMRLTRIELQQFRDRAIASGCIEELCHTQEALNQYDFKHSSGGNPKTEFESQIDGIVYAIETVTAEFHAQAEEHLRRTTGQVVSVAKRRLAERALADLVKARNTEHLTLLHRLQALIRTRDDLAAEQKAAGTTSISSRTIPKRLPQQTAPVPVAASLGFIKQNEIELGI
jgi:hypothetical protein